MKAKLILLLGVAVFGLGIMTPSAYALSFTPASATSNEFPNLNNATIEYKQVNNGSNTGAESGNLVGSYSTMFGNNGNFKITYGSGAFAYCGICALLVKGAGGQEAFFNITGWDGQANLEGTGFGGSGTSIAAVGIVSKAVPEPASLLLLGAGLAGIGIWRRKSTKI